MGDLVLTGPKPCIRVRKAIAKRRKARMVPLWWDEGTRKDLLAWREYRAKMGGGDPGAPFCCSHKIGRLGKRLSGARLNERWRTSIKCLGPDRASQLSIHCGRHTFISHALQVGRSLAEVQYAAGHANISITSIYCHFVERQDVPDLFDFSGKKADPKVLESALMVYDATLKMVLALASQGGQSLIDDFLPGQIKAAKDAYREATGEESMVEYPLPEFTERRNERRSAG